MRLLHNGRCTLERILSQLIFDTTITVELNRSVARIEGVYDDYKLPGVNNYLFNNL